ncbi:MAG: type II toxin-antitoxin system Phd/YefM family antitoxin [Verrucomicrobia bacterium]|nr:type II toxin-antitoxin system Phd/YefM family antitoxin [Verrucomicrobiota bacterium]
MHVESITVTEAVRNFSDYMNRVAYRHEAFVLCKGRKPVAELRPLPGGKRLGDLPDLLKSLPHLSKSDATAFSVDLDRAREALAGEGLRDPWAS